MGEAKRRREAEERANSGPVYDVVVKRISKGESGFIDCNMKELLISSGRLGDHLFTRHSKFKAPSSNVVYGPGRSYGVSGKKFTDEQVLDFLRTSGMYYSAFGEDHPYPEDEARLIRRWEKHDFKNWREHGIEKPVAMEREGRFLWMQVPPGDNFHRSCDSHGVIMFVDEAAAIDFIAYLELERPHLLGAKEILGKVFDPDLGLGDFGIDRHNPERIPGKIGVAAAAFKPGAFYMGNNGVVPTSFMPGMFD